MCEKSFINLTTSSILGLPLQSYDKNFIFRVNGKEFPTSQISALILSPKLSKLYINDPTIDELTITTNHPGDFSHILNLINFEENHILEKEIPFIREVIEILGNKWIEVHDKTVEAAITLDNVFDRIQKHEKSSVMYSNQIQEEIEFISTHFFEITEKQEKELMKLNIDTLEKIIESPTLQLESEDQLISFVNKLYVNDSTFSHFYEYIDFLNVTSLKMKEFIGIYDINDLTNKIWAKISDRLSQQTFKTSEKMNETVNRYLRHDFLYANQDFKGIINYLSVKTKGNIEDEISVTSSSKYGSDLPSNATAFDDVDKVFQSENIQNSWICFDFKEHRVIPLNYSIRSYYHYSKNAHHPKSWVIEASNDNDEWERIDEQRNCPLLNGSYLSTTFKIDNEGNKEYRFIRLKQTGPTWAGSHYLTLDSFELYGTLL